jgi:predicted transglutaminase-like cysteine proteinase
MKKRKITALACAGALALGMGVTAFAASQADSAEKARPRQRIELSEEQKAEFGAKHAKMGEMRRGPGKMPELTEEQKAEMEAKKAEMEAKVKARQEKWDNLSEEQKNELYAMQDKIGDTQIEIIDKQLELGLIDEETAKTQKEQIAERKTKTRENGGCFMGGGKAKMPGRGNFGKMTPPPAPDAE